MKPLFIAIVGGSGSGKTTLAHELAEILAPDAAVVSLDRFYRDLRHLPAPRREALDFDRPHRIDWPLFLRTLDLMAAGRSVSLPVYRFDGHLRQPRPERFVPPRFVILDGLWLLRRREVRRHCAITIFLACPAGERLRRRLKRDLQDRGRDRRDVRFRWRTQSEPGFRRFVRNQRSLADVVVSSPTPKSVIQAVADRIRGLESDRSD